MTPAAKNTPRRECHISDMIGFQPRGPGKRGQSPFAGTARRVLRTNGDCPLFPFGCPVQSVNPRSGEPLRRCPPAACCHSATARRLDWRNCNEKEGRHSCLPRPVGQTFLSAFPHLIPKLQFRNACAQLLTPHSLRPNQLRDVAEHGLLPRKQQIVIFVAIDLQPHVTPAPRRASWRPLR